MNRIRFWKPLFEDARLAKTRRVLARRLRTFQRSGKLAVLLLVASLTSENALAQHSHGRRNTIEFEYETVPEHDQVLEQAPEYLILRFSEYVRLVKLTLKVEDLEMIDVDFRFSSMADRVFIQEVPELANADYYTAEWAALNADNIMMYGFFCFSFGPGATTPTTIINSRVFPSTPF